MVRRAPGNVCRGMTSRTSGQRSLADRPAISGAAVAHRRRLCLWLDGRTDLLTPRTAIITYVVTFLAFVLIDLVWLLNAGVPMFRAILGDIILDQPRMAPAILFYLLFPVGILYFASLPALAARSLATAAVRGGAFGFFTYMTYELTNHATLRLWSWNLVVIDTLWGAALTAVSAVLGVVVARWFSERPA